MPIIKAICIALSTYSILPAPRFAWTEDAMRYSLSMLPLVGLLVGACLWAWHWLCLTLGVGQILFAAVATAIPIIITGGIHMDGFCDTVDALASHQSRERKLSIMKDSHAGAFAAIYGALYLLVCFALYTELFATAALAIASIGFTLSRALVALSALATPNARGEGLLAKFTDHTARRVSLSIMFLFLLVAAVGMLALRWTAGGLCLLLCGAWFVGYRALALHQFGGITGDTTGFFLQTTELVILFGAVAAIYLERLAWL